MQAQLLMDTDFKQLLLALFIHMSIDNEFI